MYEIKCYGLPLNGTSVQEYSNLSKTKVTEHKQILSYCRIADMQKSVYASCIFRHLKASLDWGDIGEALNNFGETMPGLCAPKMGTDNGHTLVGCHSIKRVESLIKYQAPNCEHHYYIDIVERKKDDTHFIVVNRVDTDSTRTCLYHIQQPISCLNVADFSSCLRFIGYDLAYCKLVLPYTINKDIDFEALDV